MNVLSLFDGMSCGRIALERADVKVDNYFASEVDEYAIKVTQKNYPNTIQIGSVIDLQIDNLPKIDLLIGGSPCQGFSFAGKMKGASTSCNIEITTLEQYLQFKEDGFEFNGQSYLFWEYIRILETIKKQNNPEIKFLLENVKMTKYWKSILDSAIGINGIEISSELFVPQKRERLYWCNFDIEETNKKDYKIEDFIVDGDGFPSSCDLKRYFKKKKIFNTLTAAYRKGIRGSGRPAISKNEGFLDEDRTQHRMLTPKECEMIQGVPIGYTNCVAKTNRYKMLGNGWTVDVIAHIFKGLKG